MKIFSGKKVLVTGHTGFKGTWLSLWLVSLGAEVVGVSIDIPTSPSSFEACELYNKMQSHEIDIRNLNELSEIVEKSQPDFVFHLAAQPIVSRSYSDPIYTIETNALGTTNLLQSLRRLKKKVSAVIITSDKAYDNVEWIWGYRENDRLGGKDPYSASKAMAEMAIKTYIHSFFSHAENDIRIGIARAGNVIGGGDWAVDRIVPDTIRSWVKEAPVDVRSPSATRPWQHVLEPISGYLVLASKLYDSQHHHGEAFNFGPRASVNKTVGELISAMSQIWGKASWNDCSENKKEFHEAGLLRLNCDKSLAHLSWRPALEFSETVSMTVEWYKKYYDNPELSVFDYTYSQIKEYTKIAQVREIDWATYDF